MFCELFFGDDVICSYKSYVYKCLVNYKKDLWIVFKW